MGCTRGDVGSVIPHPHPHASRPVLLGGGKLVSTRISRREYQSAPQASPSLVLSSSEETGLFHPMGAASSPLLCVCVCTRESVCLDLHAPTESEDAKQVPACGPHGHAGPASSDSCSCACPTCSSCSSCPSCCSWLQRDSVLADITSSYLDTSSYLHKKMLFSSCALNRKPI